MDFELPEELSGLQDVARRFAAEHIAPHAREWDRNAEIPRDLVAKLAELGFLGLFTPTEFGGSGLGDLAVAVITEEIARHCACGSERLGFYRDCRFASTGQEAH